MSQAKNLSEIREQERGQAHFAPQTRQNEPVPERFRIGSKSVHWAVVAAVVFVTAGQSQGQAPAAAPAADAGDIDFPIIIRFSEKLLTLLISPQVNVEEPVSIVVLGTPAVGTSWTDGELRLDLKPQPRGVSMFVCFDGTCVSRTTSRNGPAIIYSSATTHFSARKPIQVDVDHGIETGETVMSTSTSVATPCIGSTLPRLPGRIVRCVARRRLQQNHNQITAIARGNAQGRIGRAFDSSAEGLSEQYNGDLDLLRPVIQRLREDNPDSSLVFSTTEDYLQLGVGRAEAGRFPGLPADDFDPSPVQVWLHTSALGDGNSTAEEHLANFRRFRHGLEQQLVEQFRPRNTVVKLLRSAPVILGTTGDWLVIGLASPDEQTASHQHTSSRHGNRVSNGK